jgi:hypothetical protein
VSLTALPYIIALIIELKLSSIKIITEASLATSVLAIPIENPTSAVFRARVSLVLFLEALDEDPLVFWA